MKSKQFRSCPGCRGGNRLEVSCGCVTGSVDVQDDGRLTFAAGTREQITVPDHGEIGAAIRDHAVLMAAYRVLVRLQPDEAAQGARIRNIARDRLLGNLPAAPSRARS